MKFFWISCACAALASGCAMGGAPDEHAANLDPAECVDRDSDGFGEHCAAGNDCDDRDRTAHDHCLRCALPNENCACKPGTQPVSCFLDKTVTDDGGVMCHEGTRYCRAATWSGCESIRTYPFPQAESQTALIDPFAVPVHCNDCDVTCYRIGDNLDPVDGGLNGTNSGNASWAAGGGLTLAEIPDAGGPPPDAGSPPPPGPCVVGVGLDTDCDGIPNQYDPYPDDPPFATANPSIFLGIGPGEVGTGAIDLTFYLNSADVYFLVDQSGSMEGERDQLVVDLTTGDFIQDANYDCADYDFDHMPNNELKSDGIIGAIRCMIRDANFGTGLFRELPFSGYAPSDQLVYGNYQGITNDVAAVQSAMINNFVPISNDEWPEASMVALHNVLTGNGMYLGSTRRGVPPQTSCPSLTWGDPCFRTSAIPIVVFFTDAQFHNGPSTNTYAYPTTFSVTAGTGDKYYPLTNDNETFESAVDLGDVTTNYKTYTGNTTDMTSDLTASRFGSSCISDSGGPDALFEFTVNTTHAVTIESTGSQFDTVLGLFNTIPVVPTDLGATDDSNETGSSAKDLGQMYNRALHIIGNTSAMAANYQWSDVTCNATGTAPDAVFQFDLSGSTRVGIGTTGSSFNTVLGLYSDPPGLPPTYTGIPNTNDKDTSAYNIGQIFGQTKAFSGDTSAPGLMADFEAFQIGCNADTLSNDVVYNFDLSAATRVRISTEGSAFDTVLGVFNGASSPIITTAIANTNETQATAFDAGVLNGRALRLTMGSTSSMAADYTGAQIGCNADTAAPDSVVQFHLNAPTDVKLDTLGTSWDTVLALYSVSTLDVHTYTTVTNTNELLSSAKDLGTVDGKDIIVTGGSTSSMVADYSLTEVPCASAASSRDSVYRFHLDNSKTVRVDLSGSSFDTVLALHKVRPAEPSSALPTNTNDALASAFNVGSINNTSFLKTANDGSLTHNYNIGCTSDVAAKDAVFTFSLTAATDVQIDTVGTGFDTVLGLYPATIVSTTTPVAVGSMYGLRTTARNLGVLDGTSHAFTGTTVGTGANWTDYKCSSDAGAEDAFYQFTLNSTRTVTIATAGSSYDTVLQLYKYTNAGLTTWAYDSCHNEGSGSSVISKSLTAGTYFVVLKGDRSNDEGPYALSIKDNAAPVSNQLTCDDDGGGGSVSQITRSLAAGTYNVVVSGGSAASSGAYTLRFRDKTWWDSFGVQQCDDDSGSGTTSKIERALTAGDYWFIVRGNGSTDKGATKVEVLDVTSPPPPPPSVACDDDTGGSNQALITRTNLAAGDYWVVLKGDASSDKGNYTLNLRDTLTTNSGALLQCDDDSGEPANSAVVERNLAAGSYQIVLKGDASTDKGAYKLSVRDVTNNSFDRVACNDDYGTGTQSYLEQDLAAGRYYVTVKGKGTGATSKGAYSLDLRDVTNVTTSSQSCNDNGSTYSTSKITQTLSAGTYYVGLKGKTAAERGPYQLSIGGGSTHSATYTPPTWATTLASVQSSGAHVISILSCQDDPSHGNNGSHTGDCDRTRTQAIALANASDSIGSALQPLVFDIDGDGSGLSKSVVNAVTELAEYLEMDVQVRVVFDPDANPGFVVNVSAVDEVGDGCTGLIGIEHQNCIPGATPRFLLDFQNPASPNSVPLNPNDPMGGYNFRAELIGDDQFIVDQVPIYIIPIDLDGSSGPPPPQYYPTATYWQDSPAPGCTGNLAPDWRNLSWSADVYPNTGLTFSACAAATEAGLASCTPNVVATVSGGGVCSTSSDCPVGYCDIDIGVCQIVRSATCMDSSECGVDSFCDTSVNKCTYSAQPVYIGGALGSDNFQAFIRMQITLSGTPPYDAPPVLHNWEMTYQCNSAL